ncbi:MAG: hypothetical protein LKE46_03810 [Clostridium sp.]|jgi:hypothetical protein|uniref:hypothetical protein n=1 Tax=Clostridium sp. TaxID=1506 RepID=UPI0025BF1604|nr:hypothetical protein [Clostridium sp.]MCH3963375.1 hypothetical protein [Clostridium sp.]MCI1716757.1 hypothetical protein [Clostridium sp.]MCI1801059.1 hypothetical protein [Clostridium sp.]MCI1814943.1 hypothetical protein [Clostridium sp.]MCI1871844.1 hypothetical protein [Clostridium sp.]
MESESITGKLTGYTRGKNYLYFKQIKFVGGIKNGNDKNEHDDGKENDDEQ